MLGGICFIRHPCSSYMSSHRPSGLRRIPDLTLTPHNVISFSYNEFILYKHVTAAMIINTWILTLLPGGSHVWGGFKNLINFVLVIFNCNVEFLNYFYFDVSKKFVPTIGQQVNNKDLMTLDLHTMV